MRSSLGITVLLVSTVTIAMNAAAAPETDQTAPPLIVEHKNTVTVNFGAYHISRRNQDWSLTGNKLSCIFFCIFGSSYNTSPLPNEFNTSSQDVFGLEYERQIKYGLRYGFTYFQIKNSFVIPSLLPSQGVVKASYRFATIKKYFGDSNGLRPFIGVGVGQVQSDIGGYINTSSNGNAAQATTGLRYETDRISFVAEYRLVRTRGMLFSNGDTPGSVGGKMDLGGQGPFIGLGVRFL